jgi:fused signal recognition particle receptor
VALRTWIDRLRGRDTEPDEAGAPEPPDAPPPIAPPPIAPPPIAPRPLEPPPAPSPIAPPPPQPTTAPPDDPAPAVPPPMAPPPVAPPPLDPPSPAPPPIAPRAFAPPPPLPRPTNSEAGAPPTGAPPTGAPPTGAPPVGAPPADAAPAPAAGRGWLSRLRGGLARTTARLTDSVTTLFRKRRLDDEALEELEETLIAADLGLPAAQRIVEGFRRTRFGKEVTDEEVKAALADEIAAILAPVARPMGVEPARAPHVVLVVGVNGTGKTTTIAKLGQQYREHGFTCAFVAGDTFRAAAVEQLQIWGERTGCAVHVPAKPGADAAGLAFDALKAAKGAGTQILLVDTAGRLHNKAALMEELRKIIRVLKRQDPAAPHSVLLVLDATTGQNAVQQVRVFKEMVDVTGLAVTKLDGSAKGGVVVALAAEFGLPVHMVGVGESAADLRPFEARDFARGLVGLE